MLFLLCNAPDKEASLGAGTSAEVPPANGDCWHFAGGLWQEVEGGTWLCKQCAQRFSEREKSEHEDFHIALEMSRDPSGALDSLHLASMRMMVASDDCASVQPMTFSTALE